ASATRSLHARHGLVGIVIDLLPCDDWQRLVRQPHERADRPAICLWRVHRGISPRDLLEGVRECRQDTVGVTEETGDRGLVI
ncbi:MAG: hypothetical protein ABSA14_01940, partial [Acidimicrobiales bacterium]